MKITASNIINAIGFLPKNRVYNYVNPKNKGQIEIINIIYPEGPITIKRYNPSKGETSDNANVESLSTQMIWRVANAFQPNQPINFDRILGGSYNTRSVLEALLAHTPQFYYCFPGRIENMISTSSVRRGHKHMLWIPDEPHNLGIMKKKKTDIVISEIPSIDAYYEALNLPEDFSSDEIDINIKRRHAQMQIALIEIGQQLGFRTWVALNDKGIVYKDRKIGEMNSVITSLKDENLISNFNEAIHAALHIDAIWFKNGRLMPAVIEIEHSTGVRSGLTRMKRFQDAFPPFPTRYVIVAPDEDREKVLKEATLEQFKSLNTKLFPYSAVEELYALCQRRKIRGVTEEFLDCYMEQTNHVPMVVPDYN